MEVFEEKEQESYGHFTLKTATKKITSIDTASSNDFLIDPVAFAYDFGARMYDARVGRFLSLDPKMNKFPYLSPYHFAYNNPIIFLDYDGEVGKLYIQVMLDKNNKPVIDKKTMEQVKSQVKKMYSDMGIDLDVEIHYSNDIMSKTKFYSREGAHESDSYLISQPSKRISYTL